MKNRKKKGRAVPSPTAAERTALAALETSRQAALCRLLEHSMGNWCDDYLRQLATTAVRVSAVSEIAAMQAELLKHREPPAKAQPTATLTLEPGPDTDKPETDEKRPMTGWKFKHKSSPHSKRGRGL